MKLKIKVDKQTLQKSANCGLVGKGANCAIALSVRDVFPKAEVGRDAIWPFGCFAPETHTLISLPSSAKQFIHRFDIASPEGRVQMNEIEFEIDIPDDIISLINIDEIRPLLINHKNLELA